MAKMDATDQQLLSLLRQDARTSVAILARKLGVSRGTVGNRIAKLEDAGTIVGYTVRLRPDAQPQQISAWMSVAVEGNETRAVSHEQVERHIGTRRDQDRWQPLTQYGPERLLPRNHATTLEPRERKRRDGLGQGGEVEHRLEGGARGTLRDGCGPERSGDPITVTPNALTMRGPDRSGRRHAVVDDAGGDMRKIARATAKRHRRLIL